MSSWYFFGVVISGTCGGLAVLNKKNRWLSAFLVLVSIIDGLMVIIGVMHGK